MSDRKELARQVYEAFSAGDRDLFEEHLADELTALPGLRLPLSWKS
jgi:hypothetical protein